MSFFSYLLLICICVFQIGCASPSDLANAHLKSAYYKYIDKDYESSIEKVNRLLSKHKDEYSNEHTASLLNLKALNYYGLEKFIDAKGTLDYLIAEYPETKAAKDSVHLRNDLEKAINKAFGKT
ncbi:hypothetical protein [Colwellia piezophila]|uniref:hypothetical protein n=1 Tax=Colwellia piezophila TaxID=211668 RepID=UPI000376013E|nr:hypothetical protein [Colwellia piezophila]